MTILSAQSIRRTFDGIEGLITPFEERGVAHGMSYGLSACGYDLRLGQLGKAEQICVLRPSDCRLVAIQEYILMPPNVVGEVKDKSSWARRFLTVQNTVVEPGWAGYLTLELTNHSSKDIRLEVGMPICQIMFYWLDEPTELPYSGKYQDQGQQPQPIIHEG